MSGLEQTPTIVIGSGKGGVGKSVVSVMLASALAGPGRRVLLLDADQNLANLHVLLGVGSGTRVDSLLQGEIAAPDLVQPIAPNLWLLQPPELPIDVLVNRCLDPDEGRDAYVRLATACERFLRRSVRFLGALPEDQSIRLAVRSPRHLLTAIQATQAAHTLRTTILDRLDLPETARSVG